MRDYARRGSIDYKVGERILEKVGSLRGVIMYSERSGICLESLEGLDKKRRGIRAHNNDSFEIESKRQKK